MGIFKRNNNFFIDYYAQGKRYREKAGPTKAVALKALAVRKGEIAQGKFRLAEAKRARSFSTFAGHYRHDVTALKKGAKNELYVIKSLTAIFGKRRLNEISPQDVQCFKANRAIEVKPATVNRELTVLRHMMSTAVEWGDITHSPFKGIKMLEVPTKLERILGHDEESKLLRACDQIRSRFLRSTIILALNTGLRRGELLSLTWDQIDLTHSTVRIVNAKSKAGNRSIPLNKMAYSVLVELSMNRTSNYIFPSNRKKDSRLHDLKKGFRRAVAFADLRENLRFHDLRHTFATRLVQAGVDIITVQHLLGHAKITMTARYAHSPDASRIAAVKQLDRSFQPDPKRSPVEKIEAEISAVTSAASPI